MTLNDIIFHCSQRFYPFFWEKWTEFEELKSRKDQLVELRDGLKCQVLFSESTEVIQSESPISVFYLARAADGLNAFKRFSVSYKRHFSGCCHDLIVLYKGFESEKLLKSAQDVFEGIKYRSIILPEGAYDLGSYALGALQIDSEYVLCFNTHTEIASDEWLSKMSPWILKDDIGVVGASCSYESTSSSLTIMNMANYLKHLYPNRALGEVDDYFGFMWKNKNFLTRVYDLKYWARHLGKYNNASTQDVDWNGWFQSWETAEKGPLEYLLSFPSFPNPHIRSNGFLIRRQDLLDWLTPLPITKFDCSGLESGPTGMTRMLWNKNLRPLVVDADGATYEIDRWAESAVFRNPSGENSLFNDNRTREYQGLSPKHQIANSRMTWGDYLMEEPDDFPVFNVSTNLFDVSFAVNSKLGWVLPEDEL